MTSFQKLDVPLLRVVDDELRVVVSSPSPSPSPSTTTSTLTRDWLEQRFVRFDGRLH